MTEETTARDRAKAVAAWMVERDRMIQALGISIDEVGLDHAVARMTVGVDMANSFDMCHGGALFTLADAAFAYACNAANRPAFAVHCTIDFIAAARPGDGLTARVAETAKSGRTGIYDGTVTNQDGAAIALFRGTARQVRGEIVPEIGNDGDIGGDR